MKLCSSPWTCELHKNFNDSTEHVLYIYEINVDLISLFKLQYFF